MRTFVGIKLDNKYRGKITNIIGYLKQNGISGNYTDINNVHLTLSFIGEIDEDKVSLIKKIIENIDINNINVIINSVKVFKTYLIFEVEKTNELLRVQKELADNLLKNGFNVDTKEYYPHITIIRKPENVNSIALNNINKNLNIISKVTEITLFESTRINGRLQYIKL